MISYLDFLEDTLDYMLSQKPESGDAAGADNGRIMKKADGKILVNQAIQKFVLINESRFEEEYTYTFDGDTQYFTMPNNIAKLKAIKIDGEWRIPSGSSDLRSSVRKVSDDTLYNSNTWSRGEQLVMLVIKFPADIVEDGDYIDFPRGYMRMLALEVKRMAYDVAGKAMGESEMLDLQKWEQKWIKDVGVVRNVSYLSYRGRSFGRRSR